MQLPTDVVRINTLQSERNKHNRNISKTFMISVYKANKQKTQRPAKNSFKSKMKILFCEFKIIFIFFYLDRKRTMEF